MRLAVCVAILGEAPELRDNVPCLSADQEERATPREEPAATPGTEPLPVLSDTPGAEPHAG